MTATESRRRYRAKLKQRGWKRLSVTVRGRALRSLEIAKSQGLSQAEAINEALIATFKEQP